MKLTLVELKFLVAENFEHKTLKNSDGTPVRCRRNGKTKLWVTRPTEFRIPVKYGLREHFYIDHNNAHNWEAKIIPTI